MEARTRRSLALGLTAAALMAAAPGTRAAVPAARQEAHRAPIEQTVTARKYAFSPARIEVSEGDIVKITFQTDDIPHSFTIDRPYLVSKRAAPGQSVSFELFADKPGTFTYYCALSVDDGCKQMKGQLVVHARPRATGR